MTSQARILVADDDPTLCLLMSETLQDAGYEVAVAYDGDQLVRMAQDDPPDLLLIDLMMPLMDGFEAIRQLRNDTRTSHLPVIILTARSASSEVVIGFESGADDYIVKPYDIDVLLARIRSQLRRAAKLPVRNPLTGLPGNVLLEAELERQISHRTAFALLYIDLDNFKAFNDAYGFARGDRAIHMLADVLSSIAPRDAFLGHIGGDDFAIVYYGEETEELCQRIIAAFDAQVRTLYDEADLQRGFLRGVDRHGMVRQFGLLSLSISVVSTQEREFNSVDAISKVAADVKKAAKSISGSSYVFDRRITSQAPAQERRGNVRPAALLICADDTQRAAITTSLRHQGYRPLIADRVVRAHDLLAHTPDPVLLIADTSDEDVWQLWRNFVLPIPLIAIVADQPAARVALEAGAKVALIATAKVEDFSDQLLLNIPLAKAMSEEAQQTPGMLQMQQAYHLDLLREASEDHLTLLPNRAYAERRLAEFVEQVHSSGRLLNAMMGDLDHFAQLNHRFGPLMADEVIRIVADLLRSATRPADVLARYGGDRFLMLMPDNTLAESIARAEQMRLAVAHYSWHTLHPQLHLTISLGLAAASNQNADEVVATADAYLRKAKIHGRDRVMGGA
ncbi:MAG: diguanylate cyclase [Candidatus Viridilinea halotolerans]|uniref:Diguanylate cyclase n=1 Tax=Candidatus Viridilinea halotolerans TaxID=2491704 RepID=A0A426TV57_9CHLR|nr:MAG: diguanylate cyclase [Candidatus Viridilinea halotolerans]